MNLLLLGATGLVGSHLLIEALNRGHHVTGVARTAATLPAHERLRIAPHDLAHTARPLAAVLAGHDAVLSALRFTTSPATALISATKAAGAPRLLVVGGAGSLLAASGLALVDTPDFPAEYRAEALAGREWLDALRAEPGLDWTFVSPSAQLHDGPRTGNFRLGGDDLLVDARGESHISLADYVVAFLDELERPRHARARFTVGY